MFVCGVVWFLLFVLIVLVCGCVGLFVWCVFVICVCVWFCVDEMFLGDC